jgi:hypothetical protein
LCERRRQSSSNQKQKIQAVFMENITDPRMTKQIARETGATIGGTLYSDALSEPSSLAGTYIDGMRTICANSARRRSAENAITDSQQPFGSVVASAI